MEDSKLRTAQGVVIEQLKEKLGEDAHLLDRLIATRGKNKGFLTLLVDFLSKQVKKAVLQI